jgi:hypothetical protein
MSVKRPATGRPSPPLRVAAFPGADLPVLWLWLGLSLLLSPLLPVGGVWELEQLWADDVREYVEQYTGDLDDKGTAMDAKFLYWEKAGWYQTMHDRTSAGMDKVRGRALVN